jgi:hypothetical protein
VEGVFGLGARDGWERIEEETTSQKPSEKPNVIFHVQVKKKIFSFFRGVDLNDRAGTIERAVCESQPEDSDCATTEC